MLKSIVAASAALAISVSAVAGQNVSLFSYGGKDYRLKDLQPDLQQQYFENQKEAREKNLSVIDQAVLGIYINKLAASQNRPVAEIRTELMKTGPVTDAEVEDLYNQYKGQIGSPLEQVKEPLRQRLAGMRLQEKLHELADTAKSKNGFVVKLPEVLAPVFTMDLSPFPTKGADDARVTVVEVADYRCPYCKKAKDAVDKVVEKYKDRVRVVYVDLPVVQKASGISHRVMEGAYCARQQDQYWEYNSAAYGMQKSLTLESPETLAKQLKLDEESFQTCMSGGRATAHVEQSADFAGRYGVTGTPTFFVNGRRVQTSDPSADLGQLVADALRQ